MKCFPTAVGEQDAPSTEGRHRLLRPPANTTGRPPDAYPRSTRWGHRRRLAATLLLAMAWSANVAPVRAQQLVCLLHRDTELAEGALSWPRGLVPGELEARPSLLLQREPMTAGAVFDVRDIVYSNGTMKTLPTGEGFVLDFGKTERHLCQVRREAFKTDYQTEISYGVVVVGQPLALWLRTAGQKPKLLGRSWIIASASPLRQSPTTDPTRDRATKLDLDTRQLAQLALLTQSQLLDIPAVVAQLVAEQIMTSPGKAERGMVAATSEATEFLRNKRNGMVNAPDGLSFAMAPTSDFENVWSRPESKSLRFPIDRTRRLANGDLVLEVDLWNRLPCRVQGAIRANGAADYFLHIQGQPSICCAPFDLQPDQRGKAEILVPARDVKDARKFVAETFFTMEFVWGLGARDRPIPRRFQPR